MKKAQWTFMVYLAGDNNLSASGDKDLGEMRTVGSTDDVNIVAEFDNEGEWGTNRYHIQRDGRGEKVMSLGETDSGDPQVLLDYIKWVAEEFPADRYALVLWNHGSGWEPAEMDRIARSVDAAGYNEREAMERSATPMARAFFRTTLEEIYSLPSSDERAICSDDGTGHSLDTLELGNVLVQAVEMLGQPLDLLGMDACLMSNLEVAYQARSYVKYIVASEENEPADGWPYGQVVGHLVENPGMPTAELASHIVSDYVQSYVDVDHRGSVTQAATDLSRVEMLAEPLDALAGALTDRMEEAATEIWTAQRKSARFHHNTLWDTGHFCRELERLTQDARVREAAAAVQKALESGPERFVIAEAHYGRKVEQCRGVTIYLPSMVPVSRYYSDLAYARDHKWLPMLEGYHAT